MTTTKQVSAKKGPKDKLKIIGTFFSAYFAQKFYTQPLYDVFFEGK
jgi:hypothetical protein